MQAAIDSLRKKKKGKASDCNGVRAEDIEACSEKTKEMTRQMFNEILKQEDCTPTTWRRIRIKVIHKKADVEEAGNYMPGWVQAIIPDAGPLGGIEDRRAQVPGVGCQNVDLDGGFHEGL